MKIALLNAPIMTTFGVFDYQPTSVENARLLIETHGFESFIGHQATADILSKVLGIDVPVYRGEYMQQGNMTALVFKLNVRLIEPRELSLDEIEAMGYTLGTLRRVDNQ